MYIYASIGLRVLNLCCSNIIVLIIKIMLTKFSTNTLLVLFTLCVTELLVTIAVLNTSCTPHHARY